MTVRGIYTRHTDRSNGSDGPIDRVGRYSVQRSTRDAPELPKTSTQSTPSTPRATNAVRRRRRQRSQGTSRSCTLCCPMGYNFGISVHPHARSVVLPHQTDVNGQQDSKCSLPALEARRTCQSHQVERGGSRWSCSRSGMFKRTRIQQRAELKPLNHRELHMSAGRCSMWLRYVPSCERTTQRSSKATAGG